MKIKLNEYMFLTISKEILEPDEFSEFMVQLNTISKIVKRDFLSTNEQENNQKSKNTRTYVKTGKYTNEARGVPDHPKKQLHKRDWCDTKEKVIALLKLNYSGSKEEKQKFAEKIGVPNWLYIQKSFSNLKVRFNIQPKDIGLKS